MSEINERVTVDFDSESYYLDGEYWESWDNYGEEMADAINKLLNELNDENKELKAKVGDKTVAVEVETCKLMEKVFNRIDKKIDELEKRYKFGQEVYKGCPMHNIRFGINTLKELKKELIK